MFLHCDVQELSLDSQIGNVKKRKTQKETIVRLVPKSK